MDAGIPNAANIPSACSFTSGSMRAYKFADFLAIVGIPFEFSKYIIFICTDKSNAKSTFYKLFILQNLRKRNKIRSFC